MFNELKLLYEVVDHNDFEELVKKWKERFLKFYAIIVCDSQCEWERVYRTCLYLEAMYGSELAKSYLFYDDTRLEVKIREENAVGVLLSEAIVYYLILKDITKDELLDELDKCIEKLKKEGNDD
ncbi:MAG: hypothetical protein PWQ70_1830 [Clostridiales bacterium]|nr:hypothetical protein [Clostridiales bacterium]